MAEINSLLNLTGIDVFEFARDESTPAESVPLKWKLTVSLVATPKKLSTYRQLNPMVLASPGEFKTDDGDSDYKYRYVVMPLRV